MRRSAGPAAWTIAALEVEAGHLGQLDADVLRIVRSTWRSGGAIWPGESMPVATWYSSGWNRWWLRRSTSVTSTGLRARKRTRGQAAEPAADDDHPMAP